MNIKNLFKFVLVWVALAGVLPTMAQTWTDIKLDLSTCPFLGESPVEGSTYEFGVAIAEDGTQTRVAADDASANAVINGKYHNNHGFVNLTVKVPVKGNVKIGTGNCSYGTSAVKVTDASGKEVGTWTSGGDLNGNGTNDDCWISNKEYVVYGYYTGGEATTLTISVNSYCPYISIEAVEEVIPQATVTYSLGDVVCEGTAVPAPVTLVIGEKTTVPTNFTLYAEGKTLTGWTDGTTTYAIGAEVTPTADMTLTPVFTDNEVSLADRTEAVTVKWNFRRDQGASSVGFERNTGLVVGQATVNGKVIDVKMDIDATNGKFNNTGHTDWCQVNSGTKFILPSCAGAVVSLESMSATTTTTIEGSTEYTANGGTVSYTVKGTAETVEVVIGDATWYRSATVVLPVVENEGGEGDDEPVEVVWRDIAINLSESAFLEATEKNEDTHPHVSLGLAIAEDGTVTRVAADDATANIVLEGCWWNSHGWSGTTATVKVDGPVKIGIGGCQFAGHTIKVTDAAGNEVASFAAGGAACWEGSKADDLISYAYYTGEATTLTISIPSYCPYLSVEKVTEIVQEATVTYSLGDVVCEGTVVPAPVKVVVGDKVVVPANFTLYAEGKTLTGWTDGTTTYAIGAEITPTADMTLTPVFTENEVALADRTEAVTVKWDFQQKSGAPIVGWQNTAGHVWVAQAIVNGKAIDVKCDIDVTSGKLANANWNDWAQMNVGTKITIPSCKGAVVSIEAYNALGTGDSPTTIDGQSDYTSNKTISYTIANTAEAIDVVIGNEGFYYRYIQVVLPVVEQSGVTKQERAVIDTDFRDWSSVGSSGGTLQITTNSSDENITFTLVGTSCQPAGQNASKFGDLTGYIMAEKNKGGTVTTSAFANITKVRYFHGATGGNRGWGLKKKSANDADWVTLSDAFANPATGVWVECEINEENVQLQWYNLADAQNAYMFELEVYSNVIITAEQVALATAVSPAAEAGTVNVYPVSPSYDKGTELKLTATENFGYDFVNWTNAAGDVLSTEHVFNYVIEANETLTANFVKVNTYSLSVAVEGGANDYMVSYNPVPTIVDGKQMYEEGTIVGVVAASNALLTFNNWDNGETNSSFSVTMDADKTYTATYSAADYIVGWDFIKKGNNGRPADFASTVDNETATFYLINEAGETNGWLDKSKEAASGYESFEGAAVNWKNLGEYWYQFDFNASEFTNIRVDAELMYNYNAYTTIYVQYSVDGTTWTEAGKVTMGSAKSENPVSVTLGEDANNAAKVSVRFYPDKSAGVSGTESANDGTTITNVFVYGIQKAVDDGQDPTLLSSVPADGATGASATGRIVLNFHEKVTLQNAKATIGNKEVEGVVSGKTVTFSYMGLEYNKDYTFTLAANSVYDLTGNACKNDIVIKFTTIAPPIVTPGQYDAVVTNVNEFLAALNKADGANRFRIFLHDGTYDLGTACLTNVPGNVSLIGESMENTIIVNNPQAEGISVSATLCTGGENIYMQDLTLKSADYDRGGGNSIGRCVVLQENASKAVYKNVRLLSHQDTYYTRATKRAYWEGGLIAGTVDYLCGGGDIFFNGVTLYNNGRGNGDCITAPATSSDWGYVFSNCTIDGDAGQDGIYSLGRPWQSSPRAVYINTTMKIVPAASGWSNMGTLPGLFAEYNSHTESGAPVDCSKRKTTFTWSIDTNGDKVNDTEVSEKVAYNPVLTAEEAAKFTVENVLSGSDGWQPQLLTEQALTPEVTVENGILKWNASDYVFCYAVCKNGKVVEFTNETSWTIPTDATEKDLFSVRAANSMGGLCTASVAVSKNGANFISSIVAEGDVISTEIFNLNGVQLNQLQQGINLIRKTYANGVVTVEKKVVK